MDDFARTIAALLWLRGLAPAAIEQSVRRRNTRRSRRILASHDPGQDSDRGSGMAPRQRTYLGNSFWFWHLRFAFVRFAKFAACRFGLIGGEIVHCRAERDRWKIRLLEIGPGARDKPDDVDAHERSSQTAIAIRPTSAS